MNYPYKNHLKNPITWIIGVIFLIISIVYRFLTN